MEESSGPVPEFIERGEGKAIIMIPGMEGGREFWRYQLEALGGKYRAIACSIVKRSPGLKRKISEYAMDYIRLMDRLGIDKAAFIGESFGGMITQELVTAHPERVELIILCNTMDRPRRGGFGLNMFTLATFVHQLAFVVPASMRRPLLRWVGRHRGFVMDPSPGNEELIDYLFVHGLAPGPGGYLDRVIAGAREDYGRKLESVRVPALVLSGTEDRLVDPRSIVELVGRIPGAELVLIDGGGHCCQLTVPALTTEAISGWLDKVGYA